MKLALLLILLGGVSFAVAQPYLFKSERYSISPLKVTQGEFEAITRAPLGIHSNYISPLASQHKTGKSMESIQSEWSLGRDIAAFPQYRSQQPLVDALYAKALEEMTMNIRLDGAFMAGAKWDGVWTRDISYSILLSLAIINPDVAKVSLKAKVKNNRIIQDTGTGGSWPVSTDRMTWALAAWEVYVVTGDLEWLKYAYEVIRNSAEDDLRTAMNPSTGLVFGESSFLDWREQTYPRWMDPKDIYVSHTLGTNAVHFRTYQILSAMAKAMKQDSRRYETQAEKIKNALNKHLWIAEKGYYGQFLYGRSYYSLSPKSEALGEALTILFGIADQSRAENVIAKTPVVAFGTPCIYPQIPNIPPYHNDAIWPFVEAFWTWASAKTGNASSVEHGLASIYRAASLFNTNKENMVATTGDYLGTEINSDRQLWSVAGNLATVYRIFFGMSFTQEGLRFDPFVPAVYAGGKTLTKFKYRNSTLTINLRGEGSVVQSVLLDSKKLTRAFIPSDLAGDHVMEISLAASTNKSGGVNIVENKYAPETPVVTLKGRQLQWQPVQNAKSYEVVLNAKNLAPCTTTSFEIGNADRFTEYQVKAIDAEGFESFLSEPVEVIPEGASINVSVAESNGPLQDIQKGYSGSGYVKLEKDQKQKVRFAASIPKSGRYRIDAHYANGNGPINTENKCAIRSIEINGNDSGVLVLPQRGKDVWTDWGFSSPLFVDLSAGKHEVVLLFNTFNNNMNVDENSALVDFLRIVPLDAR
jgi:hypothetical protein